jgi:hypothetical protein
MAKGLDFGLGLWRLHTMLAPKAPIPIFSLIIFSPFLWTLNKVIEEIGMGNVRGLLVNFGDLNTVV